jgi:hypothetical protein
MGQFTAKEKLEELDREVQMRFRVYGQHGPMPPIKQRQLAIMREIAEDHRAALKAREPELNLKS